MRKVAIDEQDFGVLERTADGVAIRYMRRLAHPPTKVWRALTEDDHLAEWFPTTVEGERVAGADLSFGFRGKPFPPMTGRMLAFDPPRLLEIQWDDEHLRFELQAEGAGTVLRMTVMFPVVGKAARDGAGWHDCLDRLRAAMAGAPRGEWDGLSWEMVNGAYQERFGPEASTLGPPEGWDEG